MCVKCNRQHLDYLPKTKDIANMYVTQIPRIAWKFTTNTRDACKIASHIIFSTEYDAWNEYVYLYIPTRAHIAPFAIVGFGLTVVIVTLEIRIWMLCLMRRTYPILILYVIIACIFFGNFINNPTIENLKNKCGWWLLVVPHLHENICGQIKTGATTTTTTASVPLIVGVCFSDWYFVFNSSAVAHIKSVSSFEPLL